MMLSSLSAEELKTAIASEDIRVIQGVKGIGAKTAQRIVLELKDKIKKEGLSENWTQNTGSHQNTSRAEALQALITLGIPKAAAEKNIETIIKQKGNDISIEELIKLALKTN